MTDCRKSMYSICFKSKILVYFRCKCNCKVSFWTSTKICCALFGFEIQLSWHSLLRRLRKIVLSKVNKRGLIYLLVFFEKRIFVTDWVGKNLFIVQIVKNIFFTEWIMEIYIFKLATVEANLLTYWTLKLTYRIKCFDWVTYFPTIYKKLFISFQKT